MNDENASKMVAEKLQQDKTNSNSVGNTSFADSSKDSFSVQAEKEKEPVVVDTGSLIQQAEAAALKIKFENDRKEMLLKKEEEMLARRLLGGRSEAGFQEPKKTEEEIRKERANALLKSTGFRI